MKVGILHLSDIHIKNEYDKILGKSDNIINAVQNKIFNIDRLIILVTGDIAFCGKEFQYEIAYYFLEEIKCQLEKKQQIDVDILTCPGNHDCNFEKHNSVRETIIDKVLKDNVIDDEIIKTCCKVQEEYLEFEELINESNSNVIYDNSLLRINQYTISEKKMYFVRLNTSWLSHKTENPSKIYFPIRHYKEIIQKCNDGLVITYFHHPSNWCHPDEANYLNNQIESISDFVFLGHEHIKKEYIKQCGKDKVVYIKGTALQENELKDISGFSFMIIDTDIREYKKISYSYQGDIYYSNTDTDWVNYTDIIENRSKKLKLKNQQINFLTDVGFNLTHPRKEKLSLLDIYVYPNLDLISIDEKESTTNDKPYINSKDLEIIDNSKNYIFILGDEKYGKTSLAKKMYLDYFNKEICPIYINGPEIKSKDCNNIESLIEKVLLYQYENDMLEYFKQLDNNKKVIIIDDFDKISISSKLKCRLITNLSKRYPNVIIFANTLFDFEELLDDHSEMLINTMFEQYRIKSFGYKLKDQLIHRWNLIGQEDIYDDEDLIIEDEKTLKNMNTIIGNNYIPSVPFYLLIIIQSLELGNEHNFKDSAYGYYYEYLILQTLNKISDIQGDIDAFRNFIIMLSREFYVKSVNKISQEDLYTFHEEFCEEYRISRTFENFINFNSFINDICEANILKERYGMYEFSYKYIYYYCIGKYFAENIFKEDIKSEFSKLISKLYIEENANIVMFTIHHTKNEFILNELIDKCRQIFADHKFVKLENDIDFINQLQCELPKLTIGRIDIVKEREKRLDNLDKSFESSNSAELEVASTTEYETDEGNKAINKINELNFAFKLMEILGQVLKNYWGSLPGTIRMEIGKELYLVGFRSLREVYEIFKESKSNLAYIINKHFEEKNIIDPEIREKKTKRMLFMFISFFTSSYIYKIASCIGDDKLYETFNDIEKVLNVNSIKLVNLAIKLEYFNDSFPYSYVEKLIELNKNNILPDFLIKHMVRKYLYMYKTSLSDRNKIANLVMISLKDVNIQKIKSLSEKN